MKKNYFKLISLLLAAAAILLAPVTSRAQNSKLSGQVFDESGAPIVGVFVAVTGTTTATSTDDSGTFSITAPASAQSLTFSMIGYEEKVVEIGSKVFFNVTLADDFTLLDEAVAIGYGTIIRKDLTSSVASVEGSELTERATALNIMQSMAGKLAGVNVTQTSGRPGGTPSIRVRGMGSINASSSPLYVVDGVVGVGAEMINNNDIESIDVLKDAAATAIYGAKGANGVVIITTKSGKNGDASITYNGKTGVGIMTRKYDLMNAAEFMELEARAYAYSGQSLPHLVTPMENLFYYQKDAAGNFVRDDNGLLIASPIYDTDWQKEAMQNALTNDHSISFSQGNERTQIYASIGLQDVQGLVKTTYSKRYTATFNMKSKLNKWLDLQAMAVVGMNEQNASDNENSMNQGAIRNIMEMLPIVPVQYPDGTWGRKDDYPLGETASNPIHQLTYIDNLTRNNYALANIGLDFHIIDGLTFSVKGNYQINNYKNTYFVKAGLVNYSEAGQGNTHASIGTNYSQRFSNEDYFTYDKKFFDGNLHSNFVLGASWYYYDFESVTAEAKDLPNEEFSYNKLSDGTTLVAPSSGTDHNTMNSYFFRTNQVWKDRYMLGFSFRADGASNFAANKKYGFFPAVSAGWAISEEPWFAKAKETVNHLKLRLSYGEVGNAAISNFQSLAHLNTGTTIFGNTIVPTATVGSIGNADLTWETAKQFDAGLDFGFLEDRINVIADFYVKRNVNLLYDKKIPASSGFSSITSNIGSLRNTGFELTVNAHAIDQKDFKWDIDFIASINKTFVENLNGDVLNHGTPKRSEEGHEWAQWFMKHRIGVWSLEEVEEAAKYGRTPGDIKWEDVNGDYNYDDADNQFLGRATPLAELSLVNTFSWNGFTLMLDLGSALGFKVYNHTQALHIGQAIYANSVKGILDSAWTPDNQNTLMAQLRLPTDTYFGNVHTDDFYLEKGDFLRIRNISLNYDFKHKLLKNSKFFKGLMLGCSVENAYIFTAYTGFDPELGWGTSNTNAGDDFYSYPRPMTITGNLKVTF